MWCGYMCGVCVVLCACARGVGVQSSECCMFVEWDEWKSWWMGRCHSMMGSKKWGSVT